MTVQNGKIHVYYDGACPQCVRDRKRYQKLAGQAGESVCWIDITGQAQRLREMGIDPAKALSELYVKDRDERIVSELDAYILLMQHVPILKPVVWIIGLPLIRPLLAKLYHRMVNRRLRNSGRL